MKRWLIGCIFVVVAISAALLIVDRLNQGASPGEASDESNHISIEVGMGSASDFRRTTDVPASSEVDAAIAMEAQDGIQPRAFRLAPREAGISLESIESIVANAEAGDADAAYELAALANACAMQSELVKSGAIDEAHIESVARSLASCDQIPEEYRDDPLSTVEQAAEAGSIAAKVAYPGIASSVATAEELLKDPQLAERLRANAERNLLEAAYSGSVDALNELAHQYQSGALLQNDPVSAVAYMRAANRTGMLGADATPIIAAWERNLTPEQILRAGKVADEIFRRCCS